MVFDILGYILVKSFWTYLCKANIRPFANDIFHYVFHFTFLFVFLQCIYHLYNQIRIRELCTYKHLCSYLRFITHSGVLIFSHSTIHVGIYKGGS